MGGAAALLATRYILIVILFRPIALVMMELKGKVLAKEEELSLLKFIKYEWHCLAYIVLLAWGWWHMFEQPWSAYNQGAIDSVWHGYGTHPASEKTAAKTFFMAQVTAPSPSSLRTSG